ncbi:MAG: hypothetical protein IH947_03215 [Bacteroidetes bacterium]|nr:hypothetical protein [Bacteroidota bacterium]MCH8232768.1 hypothetical protein [Bacteroidota bacterium]
MALSFDNLQTGHKYFLRNYGEETHFVVLDILDDGDLKVKHLETLEIFMLSELVRYGRGDDYDLFDI